MTDTESKQVDPASGPEAETQKFLSAFSEKLNQFMEQVVLMHRRLSELEVAVAYLLSKDPQWVENFQKQQAEESKGNASEQENKLVEPE